MSAKLLSLDDILNSLPAFSYHDVVQTKKVKDKAKAEILAYIEQIGNEVIGEDEDVPFPHNDPFENIKNELREAQRQQLNKILKELKGDS